MLDLQDLKKSSLKDLTEELNKARKEYIKLAVGVKTGQSKDIHHLNEWRLYIAKVQTIQKENSLTKKTNS